MRAERLQTSLLKLVRSSRASVCVPALILNKEPGLPRLGSLVVLSPLGWRFESDVLSFFNPFPSTVDSVSMWVNKGWLTSV